MATITSILLMPTSYFPLSHLLHVTLHLHVPLQLSYYCFATKNRFSSLLLLRIYIFCVVPKNCKPRTSWLHAIFTFLRQSAEKPLQCNGNSNLLKVVQPITAQVNSEQFWSYKSMILRKLEVVSYNWVLFSQFLLWQSKNKSPVILLDIGYFHSTIILIIYIFRLKCLNTAPFCMFIIQNVWFSNGWCKSAAHIFIISRTNKLSVGSYSSDNCLLFDINFQWIKTRWGYQN